MVCTSLGSLLRPLFYFLCSNLKANPVCVHFDYIEASRPPTCQRARQTNFLAVVACPSVPQSRVSLGEPVTGLVIILVWIAPNYPAQSIYKRKIQQTYYQHVEVSRPNERWEKFVDSGGGRGRDINFPMAFLPYREAEGERYNVG